MEEKALKYPLCNGSYCNLCRKNVFNLPMWQSTQAWIKTFLSRNINLFPNYIVLSIQNGLRILRTFVNYLHRGLWSMTLVNFTLSIKWWGWIKDLTAWMSIFFSNGVFHCLRWQRYCKEIEFINFHKVKPISFEQLYVKLHSKARC